MGDGLETSFVNPNSDLVWSAMIILPHAPVRDQRLPEVVAGDGEFGVRRLGAALVARGGHESGAEPPHSKSGAVTVSVYGRTIPPEGGTTYPLRAVKLPEP